MKAVILAGGLGTRITEETVVRPKPMIEIGGKPILWHIMKIYSQYGINDFIVCAGYKGYMIKEFFANYFLHKSNVTFDLANNSMQIHDTEAEPWKITVIDTGENTMTGGRLKRAAAFLNPNEDFCMTYGDGVSDINIQKLIEFHRSHGKQATVTAVAPAGRFGALELSSESQVKSFQEKPPGDGGLINAGFFVLKPEVIQHIVDDECIWEKKPLEKLALNQELFAYKHDGFWQPMDTLRDKIKLEELCQSGKPPWLITRKKAKFIGPVPYVPKQI
ncbi:MAG: glucose-1-phosphate cytidylyltransferase [Candidatus Caenarcaniphilales bacterium]|nr:glucose-1-phosphate cytidylyltransferase [Candidatus Caenarcaniphilales bacterium]